MHSLITVGNCCSRANIHIDNKAPCIRIEFLVMYRTSSGVLFSTWAVERCVWMWERRKMVFWKDNGKTLNARNFARKFICSGRKCVGCFVYFVRIPRSSCLRETPPANQMTIEKKAQAFWLLLLLSLQAKHSNSTRYVSLCELSKPAIEASCEKG